MTLIGSGSRLSQWRPGIILVECKTCGQHWTHEIHHLQRHMPKSTPTDALLVIVTSSCEVRKAGGVCGALFVTADDVEVANDG